MTRWTKRTVGIVSAIIAVQVITIGGVVALGFVANQQSERAYQAEATAEADEEVRDAEAAERAEAIEALRAQVLDLGEVPVVEPVPESSSPTVINGKDGQDGNDAPPPTLEQMMAAVQQCFALGLCTAPQGDKGDPGDRGDPGAPGNDSTTPGPPGTSIQTIECMDDGTWRFTMTDSSTRDIPGPCRITPTPEPTPDPPEGEPSS